MFVWTVIDNGCVAEEGVGTRESATLTVKPVVPIAVEVPEIKPVAEFNVIPEGNPPTVIDHVYGGVPFTAFSVAL